MSAISAPRRVDRLDSDPSSMSQTESNARHPLRAVLTRVDALLERAVQVMAAEAGGPAAPDPFRGLYLTTEDATCQLRRGLTPLGSAIPGLRPLVDITEAGHAWNCLASTFELSPPELDMLALTFAPELDLRYERVIGYLHDDLTRRRPTMDLLMQLLCRTFEERLAARRLFEPEARLVRFGLLEPLVDPSQPSAPRIGQALRVEPGILRFLVDGNPLDQRLDDGIELDGEPPSEPISPLLHCLADRLVGPEGTTEEAESLRPVMLLGPDGEGKRDLARLVAARLGRPLVLARVDRLARHELGLDRAAFLAARVARLIDAVLLWWDLDPPDPGTPADVGARVDAVAHASLTFDLPVVALALAACPASQTARSAARLRSVSLPLPDVEERQWRWTRGLRAEGIDLGGEDAQILAEVFRFDGAAIEQTIVAARDRAAWRDAGHQALTRDDLVQAAQGHSSPVLAQGATRIETGATWDDIVLPVDQLAQLREITDRVRHRHTVITRWGFGTRLRTGPGLTALFAGPSGSGKTLAAQIIASALGLELYRVDIPRVVSKYIGETEKLLDALFRAARHASAILFFDEADALFGKRSEVKDAHDRYANIEVSYLLQALEEYDGLTLLATNLRHNLDEAFVRRLSFCVSFPFPEEGERRRIWERCWPAEAPLDDDVDLGFLARQFKLTGGNIRNVVIAAAFTAAADGGRVTMPHLIRGVRREYQKMGKTCAESDFGPYLELLHVPPEGA
jgi:hypothetical protein